MPRTKERTKDVTSAQRARLVVALGVLNLVLAAFAFAVGFGAPERPPDGIAVGPSSPGVVTPSAEGSSQPTETTEPSTAPPSQGASKEPSATPAESASPTPTPSGGGIAVRPTPSPPTGSPVVRPTAAPTTGPTPTVAPTTPPGPTPTPGPVATPKPTPHPTPHPTPKPTPTPKPVAHEHRRPPCPGAVEGPPGHNKDVNSDRPCGSAKDNNGKPKGGIVIVLPLAAVALGGAARRRFERSLHGRRGSL